MTSILRLVNLTSLSKSLLRVRAEGPLYWEAVKTVNKETFTKRVAGLNDWYVRLIGLDEVKLYQDRVVALQEKLLEAQEERRKVGQSLAEIRKRSNLLQDEIHKVKRSENLERFLNLMKEESEVVKLEGEVGRQFQECDQTEREVFMAFTNAVRDSHEKQRAQIEYTKYFGIILSIAGSFLAFCYTSVRKNDLKKFIEEALKKDTAVISVQNSDIINFVKSESDRLSEMIKYKESREVARVTSVDEIEKNPVLYYVATGAIIFVLLKLITG